MSASFSKLRRLFGFPVMCSRYAAIDALCNRRGDTGGLAKRIDENRELLELLQIEAPDLLERCPWVRGWIGSNDAFFVHLDEIVGSSERVGHRLGPRPYPRPWPGSSVIRTPPRHGRASGTSRVIL